MQFLKQSEFLLNNLLFDERREVLVECGLHVLLDSKVVKSLLRFGGHIDRDVQMEKGSIITLRIEYLWFFLKISRKLFVFKISNEKNEKLRRRQPISKVG